jgi:hypothetical protein
MIDKAVARRFDAVTYMTTHPSTLFTSDTILRSIVANRRRGV